MKKRWLKMAAVLCAAAVFAAMAGGCGEKAEEPAVYKGEPVETQISEMGFGETYYNPPGLTEPEAFGLTYQYTAYCPFFSSSATPVRITDVDLRTIEYYYQDKNEGEYIFDEMGRLTRYSLQNIEPTYTVTEMTEEECLKFATAFMENFGGLEAFPEIQFGLDADGRGASLRFCRNADTIYGSYISFGFVRGYLNGIRAHYSDVDSLSEEDYDWFVSEVERCIRRSEFAGLPAEMGPETCYRIGDELCYEVQIGFEDRPDGHPSYCPVLFFVSKTLEEGERC